jgi:hypothetical protein
LRAEPRRASSLSEQREQALKHLVAFAAKHMWRTRQGDVTLRQQVHLPPVMIQSNLSEFAVVSACLSLPVAWGSISYNFNKK